MATLAQITNWDMYNGIDYQLMKLGFSLHCSIAHLTMVNGFTSGAGDCINAIHIFFIISEVFIYKCLSCFPADCTMVQCQVYKMIFY